MVCFGTFHRLHNVTNSLNSKPLLQRQRKYRLWGREEIEYISMVFQLLTRGCFAVIFYQLHCVFAIIFSIPSITLCHLWKEYDWDYENDTILIYFTLRRRRNERVLLLCSKICWTLVLICSDTTTSDEDSSSSSGFDNECPYDLEAK